MTKVLWADFKSDLSDTRQHWHISFRYGWYISKCYRWYISFRYDWHNSFRCRWHIDSVAIRTTIKETFHELPGSSLATRCSSSEAYPILDIRCRINEEFARTAPGELFKDSLFL